MFAQVRLVLTLQPPYHESEPMHQWSVAGHIAAKPSVRGKPRPYIAFHLIETQKQLVAAINRPQKHRATPFFGIQAQITYDKVFVIVIKSPLSLINDIIAQIKSLELLRYRLIVRALSRD